MAAMFERVRARENALFLGAVTAGIIVIGIALFVFFMYSRSTEYLNEFQRFRAVCEFNGGVTVEDYCIKGTEVITFDMVPQ